MYLTGQTEQLYFVPRQTTNLTVAVLLDGVDPNVLNHQDQVTLRYVASCNGNDEPHVASAGGRRTKFQNRKGHTPAHLAKDAKCLQSIYDHGGDVFVHNVPKRTAMFTRRPWPNRCAVSLLDIDEDATMIDFADVAATRHCTVQL